MFSLQPGKVLLFCLALLWRPVLLPGARAEPVEKIISHENPAFNAAVARLTVGGDGKLYVFHGRSKGDTGYVVRMQPDGTQKAGAAIHYSANGLAANGRGEYVVGEAHFAHSATIFNSQFARQAAFTTLKGDGYDAPQWVEAGASGDFYAADARANRIVRLSPQGKLVASIPVKSGEFRVSEKNEQIYVNGAKLEVFGLDGEKRWSLPVRVGGDIWNGYYGGYDIDENGVLYVVAGNSNRVKAYSPEGAPLPEVVLQEPAYNAQNPIHISDLRVHGKSFYVKTNSPTELVQRFDKESGEPQGKVPLDFDRLTVNFPEFDVHSGQQLPLSIAFEKGGEPRQLNWRVWARAYGGVEYRQWPWSDNKLTVPADGAGLYQLKVSTEIDPAQRRNASDYALTALVAVTGAGNKGTTSVFTPGNRLFYAHGDVITCTVKARAATADMPPRALLRLRRGNKVLAEAPVTFSELGTANATLPANLTAGLTPGNYTLTAETAGFTAVAQELVLGPGAPDSDKYLRVQFGDYGTDMPYDTLNPQNATDVAAFYARRSKLLGINLLAERIRSNSLSWSAASLAEEEAIARKLTANPLGIAPEKARTLAPYLQTMGALSAGGVSHMPVLMGNDASTTLGVGFDARKPELLANEIEKITTALLPFGAFRGWDWAANWWAATPGAAAATSPEQKKAYTEALARARDNGAWSPVLDEVSDLWLGKAPESTEFFQKALRPLAPAVKTAVAAPYRNAYAYPPITFANVDEVDLHFQAEQMYVPYAFLHDNDFYGRPGKRAWGHPEIWNDSGTGEQILREMFGLTMRGAGGTGFSGSPGWWGASGVPEDARHGGNGTISVYRAAFKMLRSYGPFLDQLQNNDKVAIIASPRMFRVDEWNSVWGKHFARVKEAFVACLHAHYPASIVFVDDLKPETLAKYRAVLLVGQTIEMEPRLAESLRAATARGTTVFYDGTCRPELVKEFSPLGLSFNHFETDKHTWGDDPAFWQGRFPDYVLSNVPGLKAKLAPLLKPVAETDNPEVLFSERVAGKARYLFVLNGTTPQIEPSQLWRQALYVATRVPVTAPLVLDAQGATVYDMTAPGDPQGSGANANADLRTMPLRIYALLPASIAAVGLRGPGAVDAGGALQWAAWVQDEKLQALDAAVPLRLRLLDGAGHVVHEEVASALGRVGAGGACTVPIDAAAGYWALEVTELISGKRARLTFAVRPIALPVALATYKAPAPAAALDQKGNAVTAPATVPAPAAATESGPGWAQDFGPHLRDTVLLSGGTVALANAMNWDTNLFAVDTEAGKLLWRKRVGQSFAYAPQSVQGGFAVQSFDFDSASGYQLTSGTSSGELQRRYPLYGLSRRMPQRFLGAMLNDRLNRFAAAPDGSWYASSGDLGLAVWDRAGKLLWKLDDGRAAHETARWNGFGNWGDAFLSAPAIAAQNAGTLLRVRAMTVVAYEAATGKQKWSVNLPGSGEIISIKTSGDGKTSAILCSADGGRLFVVSDGKLLSSIACTGEDMDFAADGSLLLVTNATQLKLYRTDGSPQWVLNGDEVLVNPRLGPGGVAAASGRMGTLYVVNPDGKVLLQRDIGALVCPTWLPGGDLLASTWMGTMCRLDGAVAGYPEKWSLRLAPEEADMRGKLLAPIVVPAAALPPWTNSTAVPLPLVPNLLAQKGTKLTLQLNNQKVDLGGALTDGAAQAPPQPYAAWNNVNWLGESSAQNWIEMELPAAGAPVTGITLVEDAARPSTWLRDAYLEYWDTEKAAWTFVMPLLSNSAVHSHQLPRPQVAARWRLMLPPGVVTNVCLGELVLHGTAIPNP